MDEEIERLVVAVRADTQGFARDIGQMRRELDGPLSDSIARAGGRIEAGLLGAVRRGSLGFEDLRRVALGVLGDIAAAAVQTGLNAAGIGGPGGLLSLGTSLIGGLLGLPGRATGGPVAPGRAYRVGENGPELLVPTSSGRIVPASGTGEAHGGRDVRVTINVQAGRGTDAPQALQRSSRQVARAVRRALEGG